MVSTHTNTQTGGLLLVDHVYWCGECGDKEHVDHMFTRCSVVFLRWVKSGIRPNGTFNKRAPRFSARASEPSVVFHRVESGGEFCVTKTHNDVDHICVCGYFFFIFANALGELQCEAQAKQWVLCVDYYWVSSKLQDRFVRNINGVLPPRRLTVSRALESELNDIRDGRI